MDIEETQKIAMAVQGIVADIAPDAKEKAMYGGSVYELNDIKPKRLFCGIFMHKDHVTVEFDRGTELRDEDNILEGSGKRRRHITLRGIAEVKRKKTEDFIRQSFRLTS